MEGQTQQVLIIDHDAAARRSVAQWLTAGLPSAPGTPPAPRLRVHEAENGWRGVILAHDLRPDAIILATDLPHPNGFEVYEQLRQEPATRDIPVVFLCSDAADDERAHAFNRGAADYLIKPVQEAELVARVRAVLRTQSLVVQLEHQARTDSLTGMPNRTAFRQALQEACRLVESRPGHRFAVLFIDLDHFKVVNDSLGHEIGDALLVEIAKRLRHSVRTCRDRGEERGDHIARMGCDEFAILLNSVQSHDAVQRISRRILEELAQPVTVHGHEVACGCSIGIKFCDHGPVDPQAMLRDSDTAMYHAKANGKGQTVLFDDQMHDTAVRRLRVEQDLRAAAGTDQVKMRYQPIFSLESGDVLGFESLMRWTHPEHGDVPPGDFIPVAEETGLIRELGEMALHSAVAQVREWDVKWPGRDTWVAVNLSKKQISDASLPETLDAIVERGGVSPARIKLEVTESVIMHNVDQVIPVLNRLRERGYIIAMDDFGTDYSSLAFLHQFPIQVLKIDRSFVESMSVSRSFGAIVHAIVTLAHNLNMAVVAEGIEDTEQLLQLQALECDFGQGFLFAKPLSGVEATDLLRETESQPRRLAG